MRDCWRLRGHVRQQRKMIAAFRQRSDFWMLRFFKLRLNRWDEVNALLNSACRAWTRGDGRRLIFGGFGQGAGHPFFKFLLPVNARRLQPGDHVRGDGWLRYPKGEPAAKQNLPPTIIPSQENATRPKPMRKTSI